MLKRLRLKFVLINMTIVTILLCVILGLVLHFTRADLESKSIGMMQSIAAQPFQLGAPDQRGEEVRLPFFTLQLGPDGELMATGGGYYDLSDDEFLDGLIRRTAGSSKRLGVLEEYGLRYYRSDNPVTPCLVFADISSEQATLEGLFHTCLLIGLAGFGAFLWVSVMLSKWAVRPVERAWQQQRQFVAAASHELKTPLTVITTNAQLLREPDYGPEQKERFLSSIQTMSRQMGALIRQMLELARADSVEQRAVFARVELSRLVEQAVLPFEPVFFEAGLGLETHVDKGIAVQGGAEQLGQVVDILLDNARKYARPGGMTWVTLERKGRGRCLLTVADQGEPIPQEALGHLFERFYRADPARSRTGSFGLGLSIAQTIVAQHRGRIWAESQGGVNRFLVELRTTGVAEKSE